jgi:SPP1 family predicted phage head-tail adaptor
MAQAGQLDRRVQFRRATLADDGYTTAAETWADLGAPVWASKADISDGERWRAGEVQAHITTRFRVRWSTFSAGITPKDRLVCAGVTYDISGIKEVGRRELLEITAAARAD